MVRERNTYLKRISEKKEDFMFEYLIRDFTNYDQPGDDVPLRIVGTKGLLEEVSRTVEDDKVCIAVYEIHELVVDLSVPRNPNRKGM